VVAVHSHPSGSPHPSQEDVDLTRTLMRAGDVLRIPLLDHVIIGLGTDAHASLCRLRLPDAWPGDVPVRRIHKNSTATRSKALRGAVWRCTGCDRRQTGLSRICRFCEAPADCAPEPAARPAKVLQWREQGGGETAPPAAVRTRLRPDGGRG